jgi:FkbM family methyltransferase
MFLIMRRLPAGLIQPASKRIQQSVYVLAGCVLLFVLARFGPWTDSGSKPSNPPHTVRGSANHHPLVKAAVLSCVGSPSSKCDLYPAYWADFRICATPWNPTSDVIASYFHWVPGFVKDIPTAGRPFIIDVGANGGNMAVYAANKGFRSIAFEPVPMNVKSMTELACANDPAALDRLIVLPAAVGATTKTEGVPIFVPQDILGNNAAMSAKAASANVGGTAQSIQVPLVSVDDWMARASAAEFPASELVWFKVGVGPGRGCA